MDVLQYACTRPLSLKIRGPLMALQFLTSRPLPSFEKEAPVADDVDVYAPPKFDLRDRTLDDATPEEWNSVTAVTASTDTGKHYRFKLVKHLTKAEIADGRTTIQLDPFRIAQMYRITDHAQFSMLKKILALGDRGFKDKEKDLRDIITAANRALEILAEDDGGFIQFIKD